jgi:hypothetical protein
MRNRAVFKAAFIVIALLGLSSAAHAQQGAPSVALSWTGVTVPTQTALQYKVQRGNAQAGPFVTIGTVTAVNYTDLTVARGNTYFYQVLSSCPTSGAGCGTTQNPMNGDSGPSNVASAAVPNSSTSPGTPANLTITGVQ